MYEIKMMRKGHKLAVTLMLGVIGSATLIPLGAAYAEPGHSGESSGEKLVSKNNCDLIMRDTLFLQTTQKSRDYPETIQILRNTNSRQSYFTADPRMLPLFNELAKDPHSPAVHRKIYHLCGAANFNAHIANDKANATSTHSTYQPTDWKM